MYEVKFDQELSQIFDNYLLAVNKSFQQFKIELLNHREKMIPNPKTISTNIDSKSLLSSVSYLEQSYNNETINQNIKENNKLHKNEQHKKDSDMSNNNYSKTQYINDKLTNKSKINNIDIVSDSTKKESNSFKINDDMKDINDRPQTPNSFNEFKELGTENNENVIDNPKSSKEKTISKKLISTFKSKPSHQDNYSDNKSSINNNQNIIPTRKRILRSSKMNSNNNNNENSNIIESQDKINNPGFMSQNNIESEVESVHDNNIKKDKMEVSNEMLNIDDSNDQNEDSSKIDLAEEETQSQVASQDTDDITDESQAPSNKALGRKAISRGKEIIKVEKVDKRTKQQKKENDNKDNKIKKESGYNNDDEINKARENIQQRLKNELKDKRSLDIPTLALPFINRNNNNLILTITKSPIKIFKHIQKMETTMETNFFIVNHVQRNVLREIKGDEDIINKICEKYYSNQLELYQMFENKRNLEGLQDWLISLENLNFCPDQMKFIKQNPDFKRQLFKFKPQNMKLIQKYFEPKETLIATNLQIIKEFYLNQSNEMNLNDQTAKRIKIKFDKMYN